MQEKELKEQPVNLNWQDKQQIILNEEDAKTLQEIIERPELTEEEKVEIEKRSTITPAKFTSTKNFNEAYRKKRQRKNRAAKASRKANRKK
jgi:hypothetical protein